MKLFFQIRNALRGSCVDVIMLHLHIFRLLGRAQEGDRRHSRFRSHLVADRLRHQGNIFRSFADQHRNPVVCDTDLLLPGLLERL